MTDTPKLRGFALLKARNPELARDIASRGGKSVPADKRAFAVSKDLAKSAGSKGGVAKRDRP